MHDFLLKLNRRPFIKRFLRSDETQREIQACDKALGDAMQMFSVRVLCFLSVQHSNLRPSLGQISIQIRLLKEFKRFARERQQLFEAGHGAQMQGWGLPPQLHCSLSAQTLPTSQDHTARVQALQEPRDILPASGLSTSPQVQNSLLFASRSTHTHITNAIPDSTSNDPSLSPLNELQRLLSAENSSDIEHDRQLFHAILQSGISARSDAEMLRVLEVSPGEAPEALKALRRAEALRRQTEANSCQGGAEIGSSVEREFMESGIDALTRLSSVAVQNAGDRDGDVPWDLPPWTITRCVWFFSSVWIPS